MGGGNAGYCAALAARELGASVILLEKAARAEAGGNSYFTAGAVRTPHDGLADLTELLEAPDEGRLGLTDLPPYPAAEFKADMVRVTGGGCDPQLTQVLVEGVLPALRWLKDHGHRFRLMYERQSYDVGGRHRFWGGLAIGASGGGKGLMERHERAATRLGIELRLGSPVTGLRLSSEGSIAGVTCQGETIEAGAVVLAAGGFEADPFRRRRHLGPSWDLARVRGTRHNTGEVIDMALELGAEPFGDWSGCHAVPWDANAGEFGDRHLTNQMTKLAYPIGIMVDRNGHRFVDEGADFRNYTYASYGVAILRQPGALAFQLFDARTEPMLPALDYAVPGSSMFRAPTIAELGRSAGIEPKGLQNTVRRFNAAVQPGDFNPAVKDGKAAVGIRPPKSNWALPLDKPPFVAFGVRCGITFTFGGLHVDPAGRVLRTGRRPITGLFAAGELVGGLFSQNYPGGAGLAAGMVFGRLAGAEAARTARSRLRS